MTIDPDHHEVVTLQMSKSRAEAVSNALSDILCWLRGWQAAASEEMRQYGPLGISELRNLNIALKSATMKVDP